MKDNSNYLSSSINQLKSRYLNYNEVSLNELRINGFKAYQLIYSIEEKGISLGAITTWILNKNNIYIVSGMSKNENKKSDFLKIKGVFEEITASFKLNN